MAALDFSSLALGGMVIALAYLVRGIAGFGSGLIAIPLLALLVPLSVAVPLVVTLDYLGSAAQGLRQLPAVRWSELIPLLPFTLVGVGMALFLFTTIDPVILARSLGVFVMLFAVYQLLPLPRIRGTRLSAVPYGVLGGLVGTLFGTGGPLYVIYFNLRGLDKTAFRASFAIYFLIDGTARIAGYAAFGVWTFETFHALILALPIAALALYVGGRLHVGLSELAFKRLISVLLVISGVALVTR